MSDFGNSASRQGFPKVFSLGESGSYRYKAKGEYMIKQIKRFGLVAAAGLIITSTTVFTSLAVEKGVLTEGQGAENDSQDDVLDDDASEKNINNQKDDSQNDISNEGNGAGKDNENDGADSGKKSKEQKAEASDDPEKSTGTRLMDSQDDEKKESGKKTVEKETADKDADGVTEGDAKGEKPEDSSEDISKDGNGKDIDGKEIREGDETGPSDEDSKDLPKEVSDENSEVKEEPETKAAGSEELTETLADKTLEETIQQQEAVKKEVIKTVEYLTAEDIEGTWKIDSVTSYRFDENGKGALILPEHSYKFRYILKEDILKLNFDSSKARDASFRISVTDGVMTLECVDEGYENEYMLEKE